MARSAPGITLFGLDSPTSGGSRWFEFCSIASISERGYTERAETGTSGSWNRPIGGWRQRSAPTAPRSSSHTRGATSTRREGFRGTAKAGSTSNSCGEITMILRSSVGCWPRPASPAVGSTTQAGTSTRICGGSTCSPDHTNGSSRRLGHGTRENAICFRTGLSEKQQDEDIVRAPWRHGGQREQGSRSGSCGWITSFLGRPRYVDRAQPAAFMLAAGQDLSCPRSAYKRHCWIALLSFERPRPETPVVAPRWTLKTALGQG